MWEGILICLQNWRVLNVKNYLKKNKSNFVF